MSTDPIDSATVDQMVDDTVMKLKAASDLTTTVSADEIKTAAIKDFCRRQLRLPLLRLQRRLL